MTSYMQKQNLQTLKGFRDFLPAEKRQRDLVANKIKRAFERYGFEPLETPTLEYAELLLGKYGDEADKLVYSFTDRGDRSVALRYDQTVPTARVLAQYQNELGKGFRRYQIQNVFRADKPQKGRYREFTQCDADIFGVQYPLADSEILAVYNAIYQDLGLKDLVIELNDRETLVSTLTPFATYTVNVSSIIQSIDKLDKMSEDQVISELVTKGLDQATSQEALKAIKSAEPSNNLKDIIAAANILGVTEKNLKFNPTLARGLDYYTGMIFEGKIPGFTGSVGGGGRYDNLIRSLGGPSTPAVGFGLGFDRTVEVITERKILVDQPTTQVIVSQLSFEQVEYSIQITEKLRRANINTELYPDPNDKLEKQLKYADKKGIPYALVLGQDEVDQGVVTLKNLATREQKTLPLNEVIKLLQRPTLA